MAYDGTSFYEDYNVSNIVSKVNLNSAGSYIIYNVDVYNLGNVLMEIKNINDRSFLSFLRDLESHIGSSVIRGTLIQKINKEEFVNFGDNINQTFKLK